MSRIATRNTFVSLDIINGIKKLWPTVQDFYRLWNPQASDISVQDFYVMMRHEPEEELAVIQLESFYHQQLEDLGLCHEDLVTLELLTNPVSSMIEFLETYSGEIERHESILKQLKIYQLIHKGG